jgi:hypothetical protein
MWLARFAFQACSIDQILRLRDAICGQRFTDSLKENSAGNCVRPSNLVRSLTAILQAKRVDQCRECRRLLPPTRIVKKIASERRTPIFQHTHEGTTRDLRRDAFLKGKRQTQPIDGGANHEIRIVVDQGSAHIDDEGLTAFLELPPVRPGGAAAQVDASVVR